MKNIYINVMVVLIVAALTLACEDVTDMAVDRVAAPLLGVDLGAATDNGILKRQVVFYELDKSGILDHTVGIDSIPVSNLAIEVYLDERTMIGNLTTDANGMVIFEKPLSDFGGAAPALQWVGSYKGISFRIPDAQLK
jgi:hypothetical protein